MSNENITTTIVDTESNNTSSRRRRKQQQQGSSSTTLDVPTTPTSPQQQQGSSPLASSPSNTNTNTNNTNNNTPTRSEPIDIPKLCEKLQQNDPLLTIVDLSGQILSVNDIALLLDALMKNHYVQTVDLTHCGINDQSASFIGDFIGMNHQSVRNLYLDMNPFCGEESVNSILDGLEQNVYLLDLTVNENVIAQEFIDEIEKYLERNAQE
ncbi:hypothetical protein C9374_001974 [Naegleria lovaniensis]|uniref:RNI-like protein n=1 Tax=Naegleria lovaniensis TaxID=51637 RepID=A0AA88GVI8_NAELO|nr:uncharacterized protein C9374_001974 [Naegleria lovaniensis]KAG2386939.1 hypothetical protein C9374_001974 [Naegleria lovaniensis]